MILHFSGHEYAIYGIRIRTLRHDFLSLRDEFVQGKRRCARKKAMCGIVFSIFFTPNTLQIPHSCGGSGPRSWPLHMHGWPGCPFVQSWNHVLKSFWNGPSIALLLLRPRSTPQ